VNEHEARIEAAADEVQREIVGIFRPRMPLAEEAPMAEPTPPPSINMRLSALEATLGGIYNEMHEMEQRIIHRIEQVLATIL